MQQHVRDYTELCLKDAYGIYTVQQDQIDMNINDMIEFVVEPVLKAAGYPQESVNAALYGSNEACPYKPELDKILDALHCDNAQQSIQKIDDLKRQASILQYMASRAVNPPRVVNFDCLSEIANALGLPKDASLSRVLGCISSLHSR